MRSSHSSASSCSLANSMALSTSSSSSMIICRARLQFPILPGCNVISAVSQLLLKSGKNEALNRAYWAGRRSPRRSSSADKPLKPDRNKKHNVTHFLKRVIESFGENRTFSSGQCVLSLRKGSRFGRSNSAYRPICLSWYFRPLWWSRLKSSWRYCGEEMIQNSPRMLVCELV